MAILEPHIEMQIKWYFKIFYRLAKIDKIYLRMLANEYCYEVKILCSGRQFGST